MPLLSWLLEAPQEVGCCVAVFVSYDKLQALTQSCRVVRESYLYDHYLTRSKLVLPPKRKAVHAAISSLQPAKRHLVQAFDIVAEWQVSMVKEAFPTMSHVSMDIERYHMNTVDEVDAANVIHRLRFVKRLTSLCISDLPHVPALAQLTQLRELRLYGVEEIDGLKLSSLTCLETLHLERTRVDHVDFLQHMPELQHLSLESVPRIQDWTPLESLTKLRRLAVSCQTFKDSSTWKNLAPTLESLTCRYVSWDSSVSLRERTLVLGQMTRLVSLDYRHGNWITSLSQLSTMTMLEVLVLSSIPPAADLIELLPLQRLREVLLGYKKLPDLLPLESLPMLTRFHIQDLNTKENTDYKPLTKLRKLRHVDFAGNPVCVERLQLPRRLKRLDLNLVGHMYESWRLPSGLFQTLWQLTHLSIAAIDLGAWDLSAIQYLRMLETLHIKACRPKNPFNRKKLHFTRRLTHLKELLLHVEISSLPELARPRRLRSLTIKSGLFESVDNIDRLESLSELDICATRVRDVNPLLSLRQLRKVSIPTEARCEVLCSGMLPNLVEVRHACRNCLWTKNA
ncbi:hypothetical protein Poli38472_011149 [Pythium oligandrum]|uniref:Uncharacterized protein n=1 Tax=Pythium oligandrum TaxID=41045 RepID=A0A8K1FNP0_PYTOL|nr:hypothetical protein Poli38472_011149 [Pythium oligandrum]|eukprot:TMW67529.1 hypothetical protein Poli38472_011149 [Pythium oligandrum]